jgi:site-specific recombinase XerD
VPQVRPRCQSGEFYLGIIGDFNIGINNYALLLFLADTGCRVGGLVGLCLADVDLGGRSALVTEKGGKSRYVFFGEQTRAALGAWFSVRPAGMDRVFVGQRGPLTVFGVNQILSKLKRRAGVSGHVNPHAFRHGFAKRYLVNGGDLASLADLMGHTDVGVTKASYAVFLTDELQRKHDQHVPLDVLVMAGPAA